MALLPSSTYNFKCTVAYLGTDYFGFQKTKMGPSIEEEIQKTLEKILQHPVKIQGASRTDRGVHAEGQVINFFTHREVDPHKLYGAMRSLFPSGIVPLELNQVENSFHPTLDAKSKEYHYTICNTPTQIPLHSPFSWHVHHPLDLEKMNQASELLIGKKKTFLPFPTNIMKILSGQLTKSRSQNKKIAFTSQLSEMIFSTKWSATLSAHLSTSAAIKSPSQSSPSSFNLATDAKLASQLQLMASV